MSEPKPGDTAVCQICADWIEFVGSGWQHTGFGLPRGEQPQHPACPREPVPEPSDIKLTDDQAKRLLHAIYEQPAIDALDIYDSGVVLKYHPAPDEEDEPTLDAAIDHAEYHTQAIERILAEHGKHPNVCQATGHQIRELWRNALRTTNNA